jgi:predicted acylesterase/phospholipase RssA
MAKDREFTFSDVLAEELKEVLRSRKARLESEADAASSGISDPYQQAREMKLVGLAFSGGGIRSATFNLGILQGLARLGLLRRFDYLSTVSGGGYIGSWLSAWIKREPIKIVEEQLQCQAGSGAEYREAEPITFLRKYSNYLTPKLGMLSADTWALIAIYLRNLTLNLVTITAFFLAVFLLPHVAVWLGHWATCKPGNHTHDLFTVALILLGLGVFFISLNQAYWSVKKQPGSVHVKYPWYTSQGSIILLAVLPLASSAFCIGLWLWRNSVPAAPYAPAPCQGLLSMEPLGFIHGIWLLISVMAGWFTGYLVSRRHGNTPRTTSAEIGASDGSVKTVYIVASIAVSIIAGYGLFGGLAWLFREWYDQQSWLWYAVSFGAPLVLAVYMTMGTLMIGLMGRQMPDESREWWSRLGGWLLICAGLWTIVCALAFFSLPAIAALTGLISAGWIVSTIAGVYLGKSPLTGGGGSKKWIEALASVLPSLFVIGLLMFLSFMTSSLLIVTDPDMDPALWKMLWLDHVPWEGLVATNFYLLQKALGPQLAIMLLISFILVIVFSWRVDINQFSIHLLYRNRLLRGYLGASNKKRRGQPFTGFDPDDDVMLSELRVDDRKKENIYTGPYPILNTALNIVKGKELAWQTRKAASFTFSPLYSGYKSLPSRDPGKKIFCYLPTAAGYEKPEGISLGTAMAISGAAASPNMGYHSSPSLAFLMTVFNVRLGWWSGNPRDEKKWQKAGPVFGLWYMLRELFGLTDDESGFVYLSDGGHFENLGIYELVKRRCRFIIACDAGQDKDMNFDDLGNAIRKIRIDLGVAIEINVTPIRSGKKHCALGKIIYRNDDGSEESGDLIYIKASLCRKEPEDVLNYKSLHDEFPHQTTADQWFDEDQFESYRMLGLHTILEICERWESQNVESLVKRVEQYIEQV